MNPGLAQLYSSQPSLHPSVHPPPHPQNTQLDLTFPTTGPGPVYLSSSLVPPAGFPLTPSHTYSTPELNTFLDNQQQHRGNNTAPSFSPTRTPQIPKTITGGNITV